MTIDELNTIRQLNKAFYIDKNVEALLEVKEMNEKIIERYKAINDTEKETAQETIRNIDNLNKKINNNIDQLVDARNEISDIINQIDKEEFKIILTRRYLLYQSMQDIADTMHYDLRTIQRKHKAAIKIMSLNVTMNKFIIKT